MASSVVAVPKVLGEGRVALRTRASCTRGLRVSWPANVRAPPIRLLDAHPCTFVNFFYFCILMFIFHVQFLLLRSILTYSTVTTSKTATTTTSLRSVSSPKCSKCGIDTNGQAHCCVYNGAWRGQCGNDGENKPYTWREGKQACRSKR